jgi:hypothetical protein
MKYFALTLTNILWLGAEIVLGTVLCSIPTVLQGGIINEQTLTTGLILASVVLLPLEFYRQSELERKFRTR